MMEVKQAVGVAKSYVADLFRDEGITEVGLEEIEFDDDKELWQITIGFTRLWNRRLGSVLGGGVNLRTYKRILVRDCDHKVLSVKNRHTTGES